MELCAADLSCTSTSFIIGTGLKKCRPPNRSSLLVELAMSVTGSEDVLLAKMVCLTVDRRRHEAAVNKQESVHWQQDLQRVDTLLRHLAPLNRSRLLLWRCLIESTEQILFDLQVLYYGLQHQVSAVRCGCSIGGRGHVLQGLLDELFARLQQPEQKRPVSAPRFILPAARLLALIYGMSRCVSPLACRRTSS